MRVDSLTRMPTPTTVLFIAGFGRSGSTLLDRMAGQLPGFFSGGEVKYIWQRGVLQNQRCGCGAVFRECPFWRHVGREAFGGWRMEEGRAMVKLGRRVDRHRFVLKLLAPRAFPRFGTDLRRFSEVAGRLYRGIADVSGARVVVDSSIDPPYGLILGQADGLDVRVAHIVRDSRGVAFSWSKRVHRPEITDRVEYMPTYRPAGCALRWMADNLLVGWMKWAGMPRMMIRYEDLVTTPRRELQRLARHVGEEAPGMTEGSLRPGEVELGLDHTVAGNPMRFQQGALALRLDDAWKHEMPPGQRASVTVLTWPLLRQYGYLPAEDVSRP
jgi:hypothetical protein